VLDRALRQHDARRRSQCESRRAPEAVVAWPLVGECLSDTAAKYFLKLLESVGREVGQEGLVLANPSLHHELVKCQKKAAQFGERARVQLGQHAGHIVVSDLDGWFSQVRDLDPAGSQHVRVPSQEQDGRCPMSRPIWNPCWQHSPIRQHAIKQARTPPRRQQFSQACGATPAAGITGAAVLEPPPAAVSPSACTTRWVSSRKLVRHSRHFGIAAASTRLSLSIHRYHARGRLAGRARRAAPSKLQLKVLVPRCTATPIKKFSESGDTCAGNIMRVTVRLLMVTM